MDNKVTFYFVVGGGDHHYDNMERCIKSLNERLNFKFKISVLEIGNKLSSHDNVTIFNEPDIIKIESGKKVGFKFWEQKYKIHKYVDTEYAIYLDTDMVLVNNNIPEIIDSIDDKFGVTQHFWVPTINDYEKNAVPAQNMSDFINVKNKLGLKNHFPFFAGGVFAFKVTDENINILKSVSDIYEDIYSSDSTYIQGITDELFFSHVLVKNKKLYILNGALNHCCMGDDFMPLGENNNILYGKNKFDYDMEPITFFHCDPSRRNPSENYTEPCKTLINQAWFIT